MFFYLYCHHRDLHSFPTRRSSDLTKDSNSRGGDPSAIDQHWIIVDSDQAAPCPFADERTELAAAKVEWRSEEHTSELQSRFDLVCRLLLEKKKERPQSAGHPVLGG